MGAGIKGTGLLAFLLVLVSACTAQDSCSNGIHDLNETDVDCGGNCSSCIERQFCLEDEDCAGEDGACAAIGANATCFDMETSLRDVDIFVGYFGGTAVLMAICVLAECRLRFRNRWQAYRRRSKKAAQERKRNAEKKVEEALKREEMEKNRHKAILQAYAEKMEAAAGEEDEESESEEAEEVQNYPPPKGGLMRMMSSFIGSSRIRGTSTNPPLSAAIGDAEQVEKEKKKQQKMKVLVVTTNPEEEAIRLRQVFLQRMKNLHKRVKILVAQIRREAAIVNVQTSVLKEERAQAVSRLRIISLVILKQGTLLNLTEEEVEDIIDEIEHAEELIATVLSGTNKNDTQKDTDALQEALDIVDDQSLRVASPLVSSVFTTAAEVMDWELGDRDMNKLQLDVEAELETSTKRREAMRNKVMLANTSFVSATNIEQQVNRRNCCSRLMRRMIATLVPQVFLLYPWFYFFFFGGMVIVMLPFAFAIGTVDTNQELQDSALLGSTFLPVPGYYNLDEREDQRRLIPCIYMVMHAALYCFCWLPVPFWRGIWRDVSLSFPRARKYVPVDDFLFFHKLLGVLILAFLFVGGSIWLYTLRAPCAERDARSCVAFDPPPPPDIPDDDIRAETFAFNPFLNVLMLRKIVFTLWFPFMPLLHWAAIGPPSFAPRFVKRYFYEIAYYSHVFIALVSFLTAEISRFDVFFPAILTWGIYFLDTIREILLRTYSTAVVIRPMYTSQENDDDNKSSIIHTDKNGVPTAMKILLEVPAGFKINAGQYIYVKVPHLSYVQWHPFSLASGSRDDFVELHVGVIGQKKQWTQNSKTGEWRQFKRPTFTYQLQTMLRDRIVKMATLDDPERQADEVKPIKAQIRGPYGSTFTKCFDPHFSGTVIIGAGTGLTAALSVLREFFVRKKRGDRVPKYVWFVWSCGRVDDLLWIWDELHELILQAVKDETLKPGKKWSHTSNMLSWLSVTIFLTRADRGSLDSFKTSKLSAASGQSTLRRRKKTPNDEEKDAMSMVDQPNARGKEERKVQLKNLKSLWTSTNTNIRRMVLSREIHEWMLHDRHLVLGSMDDKHVHIRKLLAWARVYLDRKVSRTAKLAACFCGPAGLAHTLASAASSISGANLEFSSDHI